MVTDQVEYLKGDTHLLIEGYKVATPVDRQDSKKAKDGVNRGQNDLLKFWK